MAAKEAANKLRKFLSKDYSSRSYVQSNAVMLVRILVDNPGKTFTRNIDTKFVLTVKELFKNTSDLSVRQMLAETLDTFEREKSGDENLAALLEMWKNQKAKAQKTINGVSLLHPQSLPLHKVTSINPSSTGPKNPQRSPLQSISATAATKAAKLLRAKSLLLPYSPTTR